MWSNTGNADKLVKYGMYAAIAYGLYYVMTMNRSEEV